MLEKCRICLREGGLLISIFDESESSAIPVKIMTVANIQIHPGDGLPSTICSKCVKDMNKCIKFIQLCKESDLKLRTLLLNQINIKRDFLELNVLTDNVDDQDENEERKIVEEELTKCHNEGKDTASKRKVGKDLKNEDKVSKLSKKSDKRQCNICGKFLSSGFRLKMHMRIHTGERPFSCSDCNKTFASKSDLQLHLRLHTGEKPIKCEECNALFRHSSSLRTHKRIHAGNSPYHCSLCPKKFHTSTNLKYHLSHHTGEKNFECDSCGKAFINRSHLQQHMLRHSGEKPHMCSVCGLRLTRASHLRRHIQNLHNKEKICNERGEEKEDT